MGSFYIPLSGLDADSTALNTIANNLANMNTTAYKAQTTNFSDLFYQQAGTTGSGDEIQVGTGVQVASNTSNFTGGAISSTGVATNAAINGNGFFVLDAGSGNQVYSRAGTFEVSANGTLESTDGKSVMGYIAKNGVINTNSGVSDLIIPTGKVMQPAATTTFSMNQNLDSQDAIGASTPGQVKVYDSLGNSYEATVTFTKTGNNTWAYRVTIPDTLSSAPATPATAVTMPVSAATPTATTVTLPATAAAATPTTITTALPNATGLPTTISSIIAAGAGVATPIPGTLTASAPSSTGVTNSAVTAVSTSGGGTTTDTYNFVTSNGNLATVGSSTNLTITGPTGGGGTATIVAPTITANETLATYAADLTSALTTAGITGVTVTATGGQLSIAGPTASLSTTGNITQSFTGSTLAYTFGSGDTVDPSTNLTITGPTTAGGTATITAPTVTANETVAQYATALQSALTTAGITGVTVSNNSGQLSIVGPSTITTSGSVAQDTAGSKITYALGTGATVDPATNLSITGPTASGGTATITAPTVTSGETVAQYAAALNTALTNAGIVNVTVSSNGGNLSILGPAASMTTSGSLKQDLQGTTLSYQFGSSNGNLATLNPATNLTITGPTASGGTATITAPTITANETVAQYTTALQNAITTAGITGTTISTSATGELSIVGVGISTSGSISQNLVGSTNNYTFDANATIDPTSNLTITGKTTSGGTTTITAPTVTQGETITEYATALTGALSAANITGVTVTPSNGQLSIVGTNLSIAGSISQDLPDTTINYNFGSTATVNPATNLTITGPAITGGTATTIAPVVTAGETVAQYAAALTNALTVAGIQTGTSGVTVSANGGQLSILGPAATLSTSGTASQDLTATTTSYQFGTNNGQIATVDANTNLTITGFTANGSSATITAPTVTPGTTLAQYANDLSSAISAAGIAGVTVAASATGQLSITGANASMTGNLIQDPISSANATGTLTFDSSGNLVSPAANLSGMSFTGFSDGAATMNLDWGLFGTNGTSTISQTASASSTSATSQNGYTSGEYNGFTIDSSGVITASFSNTQTQVVGQLALATVSNQQGLQLDGSTDYQTTNASGNAAVGVAGAGGKGTIEGSSLEASNVNISSEFSQLIVAQRAFEANSKAVTTFDTVTEEAIQMMH